MNKKEYDLIASVFETFASYDITDLEYNISYDLVHYMATALEHEYHNFNKQMFLKSCGLTNNEKDN